jgi:hypothetical protein
VKHATRRSRSSSIDAGRAFLSGFPAILASRPLPRTSPRRQASTSPFAKGGGAKVCKRKTDSTSRPFLKSLGPTRFRRDRLKLERYRAAEPSAGLRSARSRAWTPAAASTRAATWRSASPAGPAARPTAGAWTRAPASPARARSARRRSAPARRTRASSRSAATVRPAAPTRSTWSRPARGPPRAPRGAGERVRDRRGVPGRRRRGRAARAARPRARARARPREAAVRRALRAVLLVLAVGCELRPLAILPTRDAGPRDTGGGDVCVVAPEVCNGQNGCGTPALFAYTIASRQPASSARRPATVASPQHLRPEEPPVAR